MIRDGMGNEVFESVRLCRRCEEIDDEWVCENGNCGNFVGRKRGPSTQNERVLHELALIKSKLLDIYRVVARDYMLDLGHSERYSTDKRYEGQVGLSSFGVPKAQERSCTDAVFPDYAGGNDQD